MTRAGSRQARWTSLAVAGGLLAGGCADEVPGEVPGEVADTEVADTEVAGTEVTGSCEAVEHPPDQGGGHLLGDQEPPEPYSSTPPTSGWHSTGAFDIEVRDADDPLPEPEQVSVLEAGAVVVSYHDLPAREREALVEHVAEHHDGRVALTPYDELQPGETALTAWGALQRCDGVDLEAVDAFVDEYGDADPGRPGEH